MRRVGPFDVSNFRVLPILRHYVHAAQRAYMLYIILTRCYTVASCRYALAPKEFRVLSRLGILVTPL